MPNRLETLYEIYSLEYIGLLEPEINLYAVDLCTQWPGAVRVGEICEKTTCRILMKMSIQTVFPNAICSDQGANLTSTLTETLLSIVRLSLRFCTSDVSREHDSLKEMGMNIERWCVTIAKDI